jgi:hypothetical protein
MKYEHTIEIVRGWRELHEDGQVSQEVESHLWRALSVFLPDGCVVAAVPLEGVPTIVVVAGPSILEITGVSSPLTVTAHARRVNQALASVSLTERLEDVAAHPSVGGLVRLRDWEFVLGDGGHSLAWSTRQVLTGGFSDERVVKPPERLARHVAGALGWEMPSKDTEGADWD